MNISFLAFISFFLTFFFVYYKPNLIQQLLIILGSFFGAFFIFLNIWDNLRKKPTHALPQTTLWFYRGNVPGKRKRKISKENATNFLKKFDRTEEKFIKEDLKQLFTLYLYQAHYAHLAKKTRANFRIVVSVYFIFFFIPILILPFLN